MIKEVRVHKTPQDRLLKELRLADVSNMDAANAFAPVPIDDSNRRFARLLKIEKNLHRSPRLQDDLDSSSKWQADRKVLKNLGARESRRA